MTQKKLIAAVVLFAGLSAFAPSAALAIPITGEIFFNGTVVPQLNGAPSTPNAANELNFGAAAVAGFPSPAPTGAYASVPVGTSVAFTDLVGPGSQIGLAGTVGPLSVPSLWSFFHLGVNYAFELVAITVNVNAGSARNLEGYGIATISGGTYDPTYGRIFLNTVGGGSTFGFQSSATVPDGGTTAALFGSALLVLWAFRRRLVA